MAKDAFYKQNDGKLSKSPPRYLSPIAAACWRRVVPYLVSTGNVERIDSHLVERYCIAYSLYRNAYDDIIENGSVTRSVKPLQDHNGDIVGEVELPPKRNPAESIMKDADSMMTSIGVQLGLSPKSRQELNDLSKSDTDDDKPSAAEQIAAYFGKSVGDKS